MHYGSLVPILQVCLYVCMHMYVCSRTECMYVCDHMYVCLYVLQAEVRVCSYVL